MSIKLSDARKQVSSYGLTIARIAECEEWVVYPRGKRNDPSAYFTNDLVDAVKTAKAMFEKECLRA